MHIEANVNLVKPLQFYSSKNSELGKYVLVIPGVNRENQLAIEELVQAQKGIKPVAVIKSAVTMLNMAQDAIKNNEVKAAKEEGGQKPKPYC